MRNLIIALLLLTSSIASAQKLKFKERALIKFGEKNNGSYKVYFLKTVEKRTQVVYNEKKQIISYQLEKEESINEEKILGKSELSDNKIKDMTLDADIAPKSGYLKVYFHPFKNEKQFKNRNDDESDDAKTNFDKANKFLQENSFAIKLEERYNLKLPYSRFHAGAMTIPLRIYVNSENGNHNNNIESDVNIGLYAGLLLGRKRYVKLPAEEEYRVYDYGWSVNGLVSFNKITIDEKNRIESSQFTGDILTSSLGINVAWHYKTFAIFAASGFDIPVGSGGNQWNFKNKPWLGFGLGFDIL